MDNDTNGNRRMTKAEAIGILARMATRRTATLEEVVALQVALRATAKRMFDRERSFKRRREAAMAEAGAVARDALREGLDEEGRRALTETVARQEGAE
jgi:hypothetical protein